MPCDNGGYGIFAGPDAEADFVAGGISCCGPIRMNNDGVVAYVDSRVIIASEPISVVADTSGPFDFFRNFTAHGINDDGVVVFQATLDDGTTGIFTGPDPAQDTVIDASGPFATLNGVDINNDGLIVFSATLDDGHSGIFTGPDPATDTVADSRGPYARFTAIGAKINDAGMVAFVASLDDETKGVFTGPDPTTAMVADSSGPFRTFSNIELNESGTVAFNTILDSGEHGIFVGPDIAKDKVVMGGDPMFGSHIASAHFGLDVSVGDINDLGQIIFTYELANGVSGIAIATPVLTLGDCSGNGELDSTDLDCVTTIDGRDAVLRFLNTLPGDLDGDGEISFTDFLSLSNNFGQDPARYTEGNIDLQDGVNFADFLLLASNFGKTPTEVVAVPEPSCLHLIALVFLSLAPFRKPIANGL